MILRIFIVINILTLFLLASADNCKLPKELASFSQVKSQSSFLKYNDVKRNSKYLKSLCLHEISFSEGKYNWKMLLVYHSKYVKRPFWFLPHNDEKSAFDSAIYAVNKYGGGFLSVLSNGKRNFNGQDPNRNFGADKKTTAICTQQKYSAPLYSSLIFKIIDRYKTSELPYLALHNNSNGWSGNGGQGTISILKSSSSVQSYPSGKVNLGKSDGLNDEDSLIYIAGTESVPPKKKLKALINLGIHTKYEVVNKNNNDCSMSNYVVLKKGGDYYNIETEHGDTKTQKIMIDKLMTILKIESITSVDKSKESYSLF